jgi:signal transduction histidine kinase
MFSAFALAANLSHPDNPDHVLNIVELSALFIVFGVSFLINARRAGALQIASLIISAFIPMGMTDSGGFGIAIVVFALILFYSYDGFQTYPFWKLPVAFALLFLFCLLAAGQAYKGYSEVWFYGLCWTLGISTVLFVLWVMVDERLRTMQARFDAAVVKQNRELLEENRRLATRCHDDAD